MTEPELEAALLDLEPEEVDVPEAEPELPDDPEPDDHHADPAHNQ